VRVVVYLLVLTGMALAAGAGLATQSYYYKGKPVYLSRAVENNKISTTQPLTLRYGDTHTGFACRCK